MHAFIGFCHEFTGRIYHIHVNHQSLHISCFIGSEAHYKYFCNAEGSFRTPSTILLRIPLYPFPRALAFWIVCGVSRKVTFCLLQ